MKSILDIPLQAVSWALGPLRRPVARAIDARMNQLLDDRLSAELEARLVPTLTAALECTARTVARLDALIEHTNRAAAANDEALNGLLVEVVRLREELEVLRRFVPPDEAESGEECAPVSHEGSDGWS